jgi:hypothetical protein
MVPTTEPKPTEEPTPESTPEEPTETPAPSTSPGSDDAIGEDETATAEAEAEREVAAAEAEIPPRSRFRKSWRRSPSSRSSRRRRWRRPRHGRRHDAAAVCPDGDMTLSVTGDGVVLYDGFVAAGTVLGPTARLDLRSTPPTSGRRSSPISIPVRRSSLATTRASCTSTSRRAPGGVRSSHND